MTASVTPWYTGTPSRYSPLLPLGSCPLWLSLLRAPLTSQHLCSVDSWPCCIQDLSDHAPLLRMLRAGWTTFFWSVVPDCAFAIASPQLGPDHSWVWTPFRLPVHVLDLTIDPVMEGNRPTSRRCRPSSPHVSRPPSTPSMFWCL